MDAPASGGFGGGLGLAAGGTGGAGFAQDGMGLRSFGQAAPSDPFDRGMSMSGLMMNGGFESLSLGPAPQPGLAAGGFGGTGGFGSGMGGLSMSGSGLGTGMNSQDPFAGLGSLGQPVSGPGFGSGSPFQTTLKPRPQQQQQPQAGVLSNPSLSFKNAQKPQAASNLNDFDLL